MKENSSQTEVGSLNAAIEACELNVKRHGRFGILSIVIGLLLLVAIQLSAYTYAKMVSNSIDDDRLALLDSVKIAKRTLSEVSQIDNYDTRIISSLERRIYDIQQEKPKGDNPDKELIAKWEENLNAATKALERKKKAIDDLIQERTNSAKTELEEAQKLLTDYNIPHLIPKEMMLSLLALFVIILSISTALYRFHQKELTKNEHYKLGFMRIRIAANNGDKDGFGSEVRSSLTTEAFTFNTEVFFEKKKIESPIPGHPTSELTTGIVNKLLEQVDVVLKPK